ncbi:hypothetical protein [Butyrivibrio sp. XPD2002]|uniref:hypothetical protein n=1 Tax=Butyrivibrio sp. XPD2002 TaxID=1280665 RepID=UPI00047D1DED|nr:hypothetical protein [Butyrivibrio sp. XPD2002]
MNKDWSEKNKRMQSLIGRETTFAEGIDVLIDLRNELLRSLTYTDLKRCFSEDDKERVKDSHCVSTDEDAIWLVNYWCDKDIRGLFKMPFSRHWIMHIEAMCRIKDKLCQKARKGVDPIARCGLYCNHCFLKDWCGGCRTAYKLNKVCKLMFFNLHTLFYIAFGEKMNH